MQPTHAACRQAGRQNDVPSAGLPSAGQLQQTLPSSGSPLCTRLVAPTCAHLPYACPPCRDLKPHNLLISEGGLIKLADLGISAVLDRVFAQTLASRPVIL